MSDKVYGENVPMTPEQYNDLKASIDSLIKLENQYNLPKRFSTWKRNNLTTLKDLDFAKASVEIKALRAALNKDLAKVK